MAAGVTGLASSRLARLARRPREEDGSLRSSAELCELCGAPIPSEHRHLLDLDAHQLRCACRACSLLFDRPAAAKGKLRLIGDRRLRLADLTLDDLVWERLRIPVEMAFFFRDSRQDRVVAFYPSPMGPTESLLSLEAWRELEAENPILGEMQPDVEALLVNRARGARAAYLVPIDECYALTGLIRTRWRGLSGGSEVWEEIESFFAGLDRRSKTAEFAKQPTRAAAKAAAEGR